MLHVGTSGWQYRHWKGAFYPEKLPQRDWLPYFAERFQTVEVNNTFYNLPEPAVFEQWKRAVPADFTFALKMSRYLTHIKRLRDPVEPVHRFMERAKKLGRRCGPVLMQLPPTLENDCGLLDKALSAFDPRVRVAVEFRHESWFTDETRQVLQRRKAALCLADSPQRNQPCWRTADWGFVRFHQGQGPRAPGYERDALRAWVHRIAGLFAPSNDVFVYFNNDTAGYAIKDASTFAELARAAGFSPTRVPSEAAA